ncbi:hypothetical protein VTN02DRAFT_6403 [Thermoascus thermophilus]
MVRSRVPVALAIGFRGVYGSVACTKRESESMSTEEKLTQCISVRCLATELPRAQPMDYVWPRDGRAPPSGETHRHISHEFSISPPADNPGYQGYHHVTCPGIDQPMAPGAFTITGHQGDDFCRLPPLFHSPMHY